MRFCTLNMQPMVERYEREQGARLHSVAFISTET